MASLDAILAEYGVTVLETRRAGRGQRAAGETCAGATLVKMHRRYGEEHLRDVVTTIMQSTNNRGAMIAPVITGVSATLRAHPQWYAASASLFLEVVDRVQLLDLHERAKRHHTILTWAGIGTLLSEELANVFEPRLFDVREAA